MNDTDLIRFYANDDAIAADAERIAACWEIPPSDIDVPFHAELADDVFRLDSKWETQLPPSIETGLADYNFVIRLASLKRKDDGWHAQLQLANYYDSARSNFAMEAPTSGGTPLRQVLHRDSQCVGALDQSPLVNHLGVVGMVRTADEQWVIPQRSGKVLNRKRTSSASVSGAVSPIDVESELDLRRILQNALRRECHEELGIPLGPITMIGLLREFRRGGKPEAYFFARTPLNFASVTERQLEAADVTENTLIQAQAGAPPNFTLRAGLALATPLL
jgi:8-oxo-dGTP pyrophosphatase MutT (NUDIX family)